MIARILAIMLKELRQLRRDRLTLGMMFGIPIVQLLLFGFAIDNDPRHLPMALEVNDHSTFTRSIEAGFHTSSYFTLTHVVSSRQSGEDLLRSGKVQFLVIIPSGFTRAIMRGQNPQLLVVADATDPGATGNALSTTSQTVQSALKHDFIGPLNQLIPKPPAVDVVLHRRYNPEGITSHNIVPGLLAIVLSLTMVMMTSVAVTREIESGTMESLLAMPLRPIEVMIGKILPYMIIGAVQSVVIIVMALLVFGVPLGGSLALVAGTTALFIIVSLALGFLFSTLAKTQLQAMQMSFFYMLPSILLSGFMFPFRGMPTWAQMIGEAIPVTHFLRVIRGVMLKGWSAADAGFEILVLLTMLLLLGSLAIWRYSDTLD
jgi:ABC-2 type transport system permease protein